MNLYICQNEPHSMYNSTLPVFKDGSHVPAKFSFEPTLSDPPLSWFRTILGHGHDNPWDWFQFEHSLLTQMAHIRPQTPVRVDGTTYPYICRWVGLSYPLPHTPHLYSGSLQ